MQETLKATFCGDELALAAEIGRSNGKVDGKIVELFKALNDPLLSATDIKELLHSIPFDEIKLALQALVEVGELAVTTETSRPLDSEQTSLYRLASIPFTRLKIVAIESDLDGSGNFQFTCDGRLIRSFARVSRLDAISGEGQQRNEIFRHVKKIADGITGGTRIPNSILLVILRNHTDLEDSQEAPESFVKIRPLSEWITTPAPDHQTVVQKFRQVELDFPYRKSAFDEEKSVLLVDGQQRTAALSMVDIEAVPHCYLPVNAIVANEDQAKKIFQVANTTEKIATQFSRALLASMSEVSGYLEKEKVRATAVKILALNDPNSPFYKLIQYPGTEFTPRPPIAYNSLFQVVSTFADSGIPSIESYPELLARTVGRSFNLVKKVWPNAWGEKPSKSKLMHGAGLRAVSALTANLVESKLEIHGDIDAELLWNEVQESLSRLARVVVWSDADAAKAPSGVQKTWREDISGKQNTNQDISALTSFLKKECISLDIDAKKKKTKA